ncbi:unnamed protein product [Penicillium salamii]|uniref:rRNA adenine N(6)-methyltransferase n=1 Tax=Penicillium salamii TaxID=1612424 RepID=A0A9W4N857_9EURO|nr:unnamed protein product [Penicillium salamii]CAG8100119.1 unnamed protein product [Penicillium salamii]CAG8106262.1 unnamed protein product [Penicillium salamii]CAG8116317.1 unnamed protein product [Penicillium salamii]CAG8287262.1 unnamed protein product [Penicillium salamii]
MSALRAERLKLRALLQQRYPIAKTLDKIPRGKMKLNSQYDILDNELWDNIFQRLSPYFPRDSPIDILDLWPGSGVASSRANAFLNPRRHVLVSPNEHFDIVHKPLAESKPGYKLVHDSIYGRQDWQEFLETHFPEQVPPSTEQKPGKILKNSTLLVLANVPISPSNWSHLTPARWVQRFWETCLTQTELNIYGTVRVIATMPYNEITTVIPRCALQRKRVAALTEALSLHAFEVASSHDPDWHHGWRGWEFIQTNRMQVAERAAAHNIVTPPNREIPPLEKTPEFPDRKSKGIPYTPRVYSPHQKKLMKVADDTPSVNAKDSKDPAMVAASRKRNAARAKAVQLDKWAYLTHSLAQQLLEIDEKGRQLARAAADPTESCESLKALDDEIESITSKYNDEVSRIHWQSRINVSHIVDDDRMLYTSRNNISSQFLWERRPFEPLHIRSDEVWPVGNPVGVVYFEANDSPPVLQKLNHSSVSQPQAVLERFEVLTSLLAHRGEMTIETLNKQLFSDWSSNEFIQAVPSLALFAGKRLKPGSGPLPLSDPTLDPTTSYQGNLEYDLSQIRIMTISAESLLDVAIEYEKLEAKVPISEFKRLVGGTSTTRELVSSISFTAKR